MSSVDTTQITHFFSSFTLAKLPPAIITFIIAYAASRVVLKVADKLFARSRMEKTIEKYLRSALRILMWALIFLIVAGSLGIDVSSTVERGLPGCNAGGAGRAVQPGRRHHASVHPPLSRR